MTRALAIIERDLRKFFRSPALLAASLILPLAQLIILGNAFGGNIRNVPLAVVNQDQGPESIAVREKLLAVAANARTFIPLDYPDQATALRALRDGRLGAILIIPPQYSRDLLAHLRPRLGLITDNTDRFSSSSVAATMAALTQSINAPLIPPREAPQLQLEVVELYPYISYMKYLLPGSITLAIFVTAMIGGGILYIDDKSRGLHEGYLVTPITKLELILGFITAGVIKAILVGLVVLFVGALLSGVGNVLQPERLALLVLLTTVSSTALISMMFCIMARINDPLVPRAIFGVLNTLLFFPSGAVYPIAAFPTWMRWIAVIDPFSYAVHGFRTLLLKPTGLVAISGDLLALGLTTLLMLSGATLLFRRTL